MIQQVNLYQLNDNKNRHLLFDPYALTILGVLLFLLIAGGFARHKLNNSLSEQEQLLSQLQQAQANLQSLQAKYPNQQIDALINQEIQQSQSLYQSLSQVLELLAEDQSDQTQGFSAYLAALAAQADSGAWLTGVQINTASNNIRLQGSTFKPEQIALLLQRLQHTSPFKGRHFAKLSILQSPDVADQTDFSVSSSTKDDMEATDASQR